MLLYNYSCKKVNLFNWMALFHKPQLTICTSSSIPCGALPARTFEQMKSTKVGSGSPMYSMIFLLIHGRIRLSISCCKCISNKPITNALKLLRFFDNTICRQHRNNLTSAFNINLYWSFARLNLTIKHNHNWFKLQELKGCLHCLQQPNPAERQIEQSSLLEFYLWEFWCVSSSPPETLLLLPSFHLSSSSLLHNL